MNMWQLASTAEQTTATTVKEVLLGTVQENGEIKLNGGEVLMTVLTGVCIVFAMLVLLSLIIMIFGKMMDAANNRKKKEDAPAISLPKPPVAAPQAPVVEEGVDKSVVAAIMAAISCVLGKGNFRIRKITRASSRGNWGASGAADNVKPF